MSSGLPSDEVAEDYKNSLEDLVMNSRYEISNLTIIAKENTEHALAISRVLENHIKNVGLCQISFDNSDSSAIAVPMFSHSALLSSFLPIHTRYDPFTNPSLGAAKPKATCAICARLGGKERWYPVHPLPGSEPLLHVHECVYYGGQSDSEKVG